MLLIQRRAPHLRSAALAPCAAALALALSAPAHARLARDSQSHPSAMGDPILAGGGLITAPVSPAPPAPPAPQEKSETPIGFEADIVEYAHNDDLVTARGNVFLRRDDQSVRADSVTWNRKTGQIFATGNIRLVDRSGNEVFTDKVELTDELKAGAMDNILLLLRAGGRLAATSGKRTDDGKIALLQAAYTGCDVVDAQGCAKKPSWRITARRVVYDPDRALVRFHAARLVMFGVSLLPLPDIFIATDGRAISGLLIPDFRLSASNGAELSDTYYHRLANNKDLSITGYVYTKVQPMLSATYRAMNSVGAYQITGYATQSPVIPLGGTTPKGQFRGYFDTNGRFQFSPEWSLTFSGRITSDRTFLRRYYVTSDDILRSTINAEHITPNSYLSISGWAFQTLRTGQSQGLVPIALPEIDYRRRLAGPVLGGQVELRANSLAISRTSGQHTQRAFASARWDLRRYTAMGQQLTLTGLVRGDAYHSSSNALTTSATYQGLPGWQGRGVALAAADLTWPLVGEALGGTQVLTPHVQVVLAPATRNLALPNEDARAIELEDGNLFALNRFPGNDRIEDGMRFTYGLDWQLERPRWRVNATVGQSYRLTSSPTLLPNGTGLSDRTSDIVGRTELRYRDKVKFTHRYRLDKDNLAVRRNEVDATVGTEQTYIELGYARLNRNISKTLEDLQDSEELRAAARIAFARNWSVFGSGVFDLSGANLLANAKAAAFQPLRTRFGVAFQNDCFEFDLTWRRDYLTIGDASQGSSFLLHFSLRNLGFR